MNKKILVVPLVLSLLSVAIVAGNPEWITSIPGVPIEYPWINFKITGSGLHIASDPLFDSTVVNFIPPFDPGAVDLLKGWVTFTCATDQPSGKNGLKGFDFSVTAKDIPPGSYDVKAYPTLAFLPGVPPVQSDDFGAPPYTLGTLIVGGDGEGELEGFYDLPSGFYAWRITVESAGTPILETHWIDAADFEVIS
jgi:hypothetical protein